MTSIPPPRGPAPRPCESCPYRKDVPSGLWGVGEYERLVAYDAPTYHQPPGVFLCHQTTVDDPRVRMCAGWCGTHGKTPGHDLLALQVGVLVLGVDPADVEAALEYTTDVELWGSGAEAAAHGMRDVDLPSVEALRVASKIIRKRSDIQGGAS